MKKRITSLALALCFCMSSQSVAYAGQQEPFIQADAPMVDASDLAARADVIPTPTEVYNAMIALQDREEYKEGTPWTNDEPYSDSKGYYRWKGGTLGGTSIAAVGCVAFAFILSDEAFGGLPARMYEAGKFKFEDIKVGDILRVNNDVHTVIVLEVNDAGVVVAEGNISTGDHKGKVHWGRTISKEEVMSNTSHYITRYPEDYISPDDPTANEIIGEGFLDEGLTWKLTKAGTLTISGSGAMPDFAGVGEQPWNDKSDKIRKVVIDNGVTSIGSCAFWNCGVLSAEIASSVTTIGNSAFRGSSIISVTIPASVKTIGDSAFRECPNLSSVTVSEGVERIGQSAFQSCAKLGSIALPASIKEVGSAAFFQCQALISATFAPGSEKVTLGDNLFTQCYNLMGVTLPKSIDRIGDGMFQNCRMLPGVIIPQGAESIGASAFASCAAFTTVVIPASVESIGISAFSACPLETIYFTGSEEQWKSVSKMGDTASAVSKVKVECNYVPPVEPDPDDDNTGNNPGGDNSGGNNPGGDNSGGNNSGDGDSSGGNNPGGGNDSVNSNISNADVKLSQTSYTYDGKAKTPSVTVTLGGKALVFNTDYTVSYNNNIQAGTATVTVTGKGRYTGSKTASFTIRKAEEPKKANISNANVKLSKTSYTYDGKAKTPSVTVTLDGKTLVRNTDYTVSYANHTKVGTATVTVTGKGNYIGCKTASFTITKASAQSTAPSITCKKTVYQVAYGAKPFKINASSKSKLAFTSSKPKIAAVNKNSGKVTIKGTGIATITIKAGKATKKVTIKVSPKKQTVKSAKTAKGKKLTVQYAKDTKASGYQVQISTDKKFKKNVKTKKLSKTSYTFTKLKTGKKYYVRVRSYKKSGKETLYGTWSKVKLSSKIKK